MSYSQFVVNTREFAPQPGLVYVGRPSPWGNPFKVGAQYARGEAVRQYARWIVAQEGNAPRLDEIRLLKGQLLACWCAPALCHAHVLACIANEPNGLDRIVTWLAQHEERV